MKKIEQLTQNDWDEALDRAETLQVEGFDRGETYFFQDNNHCIVITQDKRGFSIRIKTRNALQYKTYGVVSTAVTAYEMALDCIEADEL